MTTSKEFVGVDRNDPDPTVEVCEWQYESDSHWAASMFSLTDAEVALTVPSRTSWCRVPEITVRTCPLYCSRMSPRVITSNVVADGCKVFQPAFNQRVKCCR